MAYVSRYPDVDVENKIPADDEIEDDIFIDLVKSRPWLYDISDKNYSDKLMNYNAWKEISLLLNETVENCEARWKKLKNNYQREKSLREKETRSGSGRSRRIPWKLFDHMKSLLEKKNECSFSVTNVSLKNNEINERMQTASELKKNKRKAEETHVEIDTILKKVNSAIDYIGNAMQNRISENIKDKNSDPDELFSLLVVAELRENQDENLSRKNYKQIMKYLVNLDEI